jgi:hypothetical protein
MARRTIAPALADIAQDIAGEIPLPVVLQWEAGSKTAAIHRSILEDYSIQGTVVCSDSAGLSRLTQQRTLLEVMKLVHDPKEVVYGYGSSIGGKDIAGNRVNIASKLVEDVDENGDIWVEESTGYKKGEPFAVPVSHITLRGWRVS